MEQTPEDWTRAALVVGGIARRDGTVLLVCERTIGDQGPDQWVLPGGPVEPGELLDAAVKRNVHEETGLTVGSVDSLAFGTQHYPPGGGAQPLLFLVFNVELEDPDGGRFNPNDPDDLIIEARFLPVAEAINNVLSAGVTPGSQSTADFLARPPGSPPPIWLWDLNKSPERPLARLPAS